MQVLCGLQVLFLLFNCQTPAFGNRNPEKRDLKELEKLCISVREKSMASKNLFQKFLFVFGKGF